MRTAHGVDIIVLGGIALAGRLKDEGVREALGFVELVVVHELDQLRQLDHKLMGVVQHDVMNKVVSAS